MRLLEVVFTKAAPAFDNLFMGCVFNINTVHTLLKNKHFKHFIEVHIFKVVNIFV